MKLRLSVIWCLLGVLAVACGEAPGSTPAPCAASAECLGGEVCRLSDSAVGECVAVGAPTGGELDEVLVPAGPTYRGCNPALDAGCAEDELPQASVAVPVFAVGRTEVPAATCAAFLTAHGNACGDEMCVDTVFGTPPVVESAGSWSATPGKAALPATDVTWYGAVELCAWIGASLCSEAQWEKAARGGCELVAGDCATGMRVYPWGNAEPSCEVAVMHAEGDWGCGTGTVATVGSKPAGQSPYGALDMAGNVWEWTRDSYLATYEGAPVDGSAREQGEGGLRVIRGGGIMSQASYLRASERDGGGADDASELRGFRCCRTVP